MHRLFAIETRLALIALRAGLRWEDVRELTFARFAELCAERRR